MEKIEPYWHKNKEWYYYDEKERKYKLTDKATEKAKQSYYEYYRIGDRNIESSNR